MTVQLSDVIVSEIFTGHAILATEKKSNLLASGALVRDTELDTYLAGEGQLFHPRSFKDLDDDEPNISNDIPADRYTGGNNDSKPTGIASLKESVTRLSRNKSWSSMDMVAALLAEDPMAAISQRVGQYWARHLQRTFIAVGKGVFANNAIAPNGDSTHIVDDLTNDVRGTSYVEGVTDFNNGAFLDTIVTIGDSMSDLGLVQVHSIVYNRMLKNKLIERTVIDPTTGLPIDTYLGRRVIVDDSMPNADGVFETWIFGAGAFRLGLGSPRVPTEVKRHPEAGNGGGQEVLYNRIELAIHPVGHAFAGSVQVAGGPSNEGTSGNLANGNSWARVYPERKQIKMARLITREYGSTAN